MEAWQLLTRIGRGVLYRRKVLALSILIGSLVVLMSATYYFSVSKTPPRYRASATILLEVQSDKIPLFQEWVPRRSLPVQLAILQSRSLAESVLESLPKTALDDLLKNAYYTDYTLEVSNFFRRLAGNEPIVQSPQRLALQELQNSRVSFTTGGREGRGRDGIVQIHAEASNPRVAMDLVSTYIEVLIARTRSFNVEDARVSREFVEQQLTEAKKNLKASEDQLAAFSRARGGVAIPERHKETVARLSSMEASLAEIQSSKRLTQVRLAALREKVDVQRSSTPSTPAPRPASTTTINVQTLQSHLARLERQLLEFQGKYTDEHPRVIQVHEQITETREKLLALLKETTQITPVKGAVAPSERESFTNQVVALEARLLALNAQEEALQTQIPQLKRTLAGLSADELEYSRLLGETEGKRRLYALLSEKLTGARSREQGEMRAVKVIDTPDYPLPSTDRRSLGLFAMAAALALALGAGIPALVEYVQMPVETKTDISSSLNLPVLGVVPLLRNATALSLPGLVPLLWSRRERLPDRKSVAAALDTQSEELWFFTESFRRIRAAVQIATMGKPVRAILVTSAHQKEGKSSVLLNLGMSFWEVGKRVILADADFYRPTLPKSLKVRGDHGLTDLLSGESNVQSALVPVADGLWVSGRSSLAPSQGRMMLATSRVREVVDEMAQEADLVLFDSSPLLMFPDNLFLAAHVDGVILVAKAGETRLRDLEKVKSMLEQAGATILGVVLNEMSRRPLRSYYKLYMRYYKSFVKEKVTT